MRSTLVSCSGSSILPCRNVILSVTLWRAALRRATARASGEMSVANILVLSIEYLVLSSSRASVTAMQPEPVPMSAMVNGLDAAVP